MKNLIFLLLLTIMLFSCTSDKHYEKYLSRDGGTWDISILKWQRVESTITNQNITNGEINNAGYIKFENTGTMSFVYGFDTFQRNSIAVWSVSEQKVQIVYDNVQGGANGTLLVDLNIDKNGSDKVTLQGTETWANNIGGSFSNTFSYELQRR